MGIADYPHAERPGAMLARPVRVDGMACGCSVAVRRHEPMPVIIAGLVAAMRVAVVVLTLSAGATARATDVAAIVASLYGERAECAYLHELCVAARTAKWSAREAMSESRANHQRSRVLLADETDDDARAGVRLQDRAVQDHLTAASRHRADAIAAFYEARKLIAAKHGRERRCGTCPGI